MHNNKTETRKYAVIVAGGSGIRAGGDMPKQFQPLLGRPMLWWSMKAFKAEDSETQLIIVLHPGFFDDWDMLFNELPENERFGHEIVCGGRTRAESVANGLLAIPDASDALVESMTLRVRSCPPSSSDAAGRLVPKVQPERFQPWT